MTTKAERIAEVKAEYDRKDVSANRTRDIETWKVDCRYVERMNGFRAIRDAKIAEIEAEE